VPPRRGFVRNRVVRNCETMHYLSSCAVTKAAKICPNFSNERRWLQASRLVQTSKCDNYFARKYAIARCRRKNLFALKYAIERRLHRSSLFVSVMFFRENKSAGKLDFYANAPIVFADIAYSYLMTIFRSSY